MGSLMAGWQSPHPDSKALTYQRNRSFTNGEIEAYWRSKKKTEEEHLRAISDSSQNSTEESTSEESGPRFQTSSSLILADAGERVDSKTGPEKLREKINWWSWSNWAFLNEPPVIITEGSSYKYESQHYVSGFGSSKPDSCPGIST